MANSSPPRRATMSLGRTCCTMRRETATRNSSPTLWPRLSLMSLKRSKSRNITANARAGSARARCDALLERLVEAAPVGSPVRLSWKAMCCSSASALRRAVMSCACRIRHGAPTLAVGEEAAVHRHPDLVAVARGGSAARASKRSTLSAADLPSALSQRGAVVVDDAQSLKPLPIELAALAAEQARSAGLACSTRPVGRHQRHADRRRG